MYEQFSVNQKIMMFVYIQGEGECLDGSDVYKILRDDLKVERT